MNKGSALVIGGGIAGLAAARELGRHQISTTVLEAKSHFGGRIRTLHDGRLTIELGAEFVHGQSRPLVEAIEEANLLTQPVQDKHRIFENGQFSEIKIWDIVSDVLNRVDIHKPDCSIETFLQSVEEPARTLVRNFITGFDAADTHRISAHARRRAEYAAEQMQMETQQRIVNGYSALVNQFAQEIEGYGGRLISGTTVRRIRWSPGNVGAYVDRIGATETIFADAAVITLPVGVLKTNEVKFEPSLPEKIEAAKGIEFGNVVKIIFHFDERLWEDFGFVHVPSQPLPTWWSDPRGPILTGWAGGPKADAILKLSGAELETIGLEILSQILAGNPTVANLRRHLVASHYHNWAADPHIRGAYSYIPVNGLDFPRLLAAPVAGTLFFAGEATVTDGQTGTVFGALETGLRAAHELLESQAFCMVRAA
ncbi:MAG TPA: NAD(P)/FAD-dependent oxidoreductase [Pseudomonadales bacterium]|nr:NAD(P)/FAD-dependent oxidoreductase [Pseudomonadales bacterium]